MKAINAALFGTDLFGDPIRQNNNKKESPLAETFVYPPFSVLNAREGWWQERKAAWIGLGIQSELGRGADIVPNGSRRPASQDGVFQRGYGTMSNGKDPARSNGQDLMRGENKKFNTRSYDDREWRLEKGIKGCAENQSGTSIFDPVLCELCYRWFSYPGATVLDPFAGGSVRGIVAAMLQRAYIGIDLSAPQIAANRTQAEAICTPSCMPEWIVGDSSRVLGLVEEEVDMLFTCPPYYDLEVYSDDAADLSNMEWNDFLSAYRQIIKDSCSLLHPDRFAAIVVGEVRDNGGAYRNLVGATIQAFIDAGLAYYNEAILVTAVGSLPLRVNRQFLAGRKLGKTHQNVLVFVKGDPFVAREWKID